MLAHWIRTPHATTSPPVGAVQTWRGQRESRDTDTSAWTEPMQRICIHDVYDDARHLVTVGKKPISFLPSSAPPLFIRAWRTLPSIYVSMEGWTPALPGKHNEKSSHRFVPCHLQCSSGSMAGLSVVLDTHKQNHPAGKPQIVSKTSLPLHHRRRTSTPTASSFLQRCFLCHKELAKDSDIYMYRGDRAFCSVECRRRQISMDEDDAVGGFAD